MVIDPTYSATFSDLPESQRKEILDSVKDLKENIAGWKQQYGKDLSPDFGGIGIDTLELKDNEVMTLEGKKQGAYYNILNNYEKMEKKIIAGKREKLRTEKDKVKRKAGKEILDQESRSLKAKRKSLESSLKKLRMSLKDAIEPVKRKRQNYQVDLTSNNDKIPRETTLRDQFRVLQGYNSIARERLWDKTEFKIEFGGRPVKFILRKAPQGYFQIFYENPIKEEKYQKKGTSYDNDIFVQLDTIKGDSEIETRQKQVKIAKFIIANLDSKMGEQPKYETLVEDVSVPIKELEDVRTKRAVEDLVILGNVVEAAALPQKQLDHWLAKIDDESQSGAVVDTSKNIEELQKEPGARWEEYKPSGRTVASDVVFNHQLSLFASGDLDSKSLNEIFSEEEFPARMQKGTEASRIWAADAETQARLVSSIEFAPVTLSASNSPEVSIVTEQITKDLIDKDNMGVPPKEEAMDVDINNQRGVKRKLIDADNVEIKAKIKMEAEVVDSDGEKCTKRQGACSLKDKRIELDEDSVKVENDVLSYNLYESHSKDKKYTAKTNLDPESLSSVKYGAEQDKYESNSGRKKFARAAGTAFGVYGTVMSAFGAISSFERGDTEHGVISALQASHSLGSLTKINEMVERVSEKALLKAVAKGASKVGLNKIAKAASNKLLKMAERDSERLMGDIPYVGLAFDAYFIAEDISDLKNATERHDTEAIALDSVHLILDIGQAAANIIVDILGPEFEPVVWALSLIRMAIDDFYYDISTELKKAHGTGKKIVAFFKGLGEGFVDFLTGGLLRSLKQLNEQKKHDTKLLQKFANPKLYFNLTSDCKIIDFTSGSFSSYGGGLQFKFNDDDSFTVTITDAPGEGDTYLSKTKTFSCPGLTDIILGIGESQSLGWKTQEAKLFTVIPTASAEVINSFADDKNSLYGSYTGNKQNNTFIAYQGNFSKVLPKECKDPDATGSVDFRLKNYFYILNGMDGNDTFFLGPQESYVTGGKGHDLYYLGTHGGKTVIDNFAYDKLSDTLWLNVSHEHVKCGRKDYNLLVQYCGTHMVVVKNWFYPATNDFQRHLVVLTRDGVQLKIKDIGLLNEKYTIDCVPVSIDLSKSTKGNYVDLSRSPYTEVVTITGSTNSDTIIGNDESNFINAGPGSNTIKGGQGEDTYMIKPKGGCDHIDNYAEDQLQDKLFIPIDYEDIKVEASSPSNAEPPEGRPKRKSKASKKNRDNFMSYRDSTSQSGSAASVNSQLMDLKISFKQGEKDDVSKLTSHFL